MSFCTCRQWDSVNLTWLSARGLELKHLKADFKSRGHQLGCACHLNNDAFLAAGLGRRSLWFLVLLVLKFKAPSCLVLVPLQLIQASWFVTLHAYQEASPALCAEVINSRHPRVKVLMVHMKAKPVKLGLLMKSDPFPVVGHTLLSLVMPHCQIKPCTT